MTSNQRKLIPVGIMTLLGLFPLFNSLSNPHLASLRGPDVLQLVAIGFCFGAAFGTLMAFLRGPRSG
jgi:hypothetical protein